MDEDLRILAQSGRHRPQRCRQTDRKAGGAVAHVQVAAYGEWPKAIAVDFVRLLNSPSTWKDLFTPLLWPPLTRIITILLAAATLANSEENLSSVSRESELVTPTTARIIGYIHDGTPLQQEPTKPEFVVSARDILDKKTYQQGGRSITFQRITPIALPLPPPTINAVGEIPNVPLEPQTTAVSEKGSTEEFVMAGATVFHGKASPALSLVEIRSPEGGQPVQFWSSADFGLLSAISSFVGTDGKTHSLMLMWSASEVKSLADLFNPPIDPAADPDSDGWTNAQEAAVGTNPFDAQSPSGFVRPDIIHIPAVWGEDNGNPVLITPNTIRVSWQTIPSKQYTLLFSPDLTAESWLPVEDAYVDRLPKVRS